MKHYTEVDLLETYYTAPGESMPVMMHLAECSDCAARYERLEAKLRSARGSCDTETKPETFWSRQRLGVQRRIERITLDTARARRFARIAAAAVLSFVLGGAVVYETSVVPAQHRALNQSALAASPAAATAMTTEAAADDLLLREPWESDELSDFHNVVSWESWVADSGSSSADGSSL
jgi:hypothetical protein